MIRVISSRICRSWVISHCVFINLSLAVVIERLRLTVNCALMTFLRKARVIDVQLLAANDTPGP
jgi:hypothetical protein